MDSSLLESLKNEIKEFRSDSLDISLKALILQKKLEEVAADIVEVEKLLIENTQLDDEHTKKHSGEIHQRVHEMTEDMLQYFHAVKNDIKEKKSLLNNIDFELDKYKCRIIVSKKKLLDFYEHPASVERQADSGVEENIQRDDANEEEFDVTDQNAIQNVNYGVLENCVAGPSEENLNISNVVFKVETTNDIVPEINPPIFLKPEHNANTDEIEIKDEPIIHEFADNNQADVHPEQGDDIHIAPVNIEVVDNSSRDYEESGSNHVRNKQKDKSIRAKRKKRKNSDNHAVTDKNWIVMHKPLKSPYYPQLGDRVVYLQREHRLYVETYSRFISDYNKEKTNKKLIDNTDHEKPWEFIQLEAYEYVEVEDISYEMMPRRACLSLKFINNKKHLKFGTFRVKYHDMKNVIDFLVLNQIFDRSVKRSWHEGERFRCAMYDKWHYGVIISIENGSNNLPFMKYRIRWDDDGKEDVLSPWELERVVDSTALHKIPIPITREEYQTLVYQSEQGDWPIAGRDETCKFILEEVESLINLPGMKPFVQLNDNDSYNFNIEYPIDLYLIKVRLKTRFYRRLPAIKFDVEFLTKSVEVIVSRNIEIKLSKKKVLRNTLPTIQAITMALLTIIENIEEPRKYAAVTLFNENKSILKIEQEPNEGSLDLSSVMKRKRSKDFNENSRESVNFHAKRSNALTASDDDTNSSNYEFFNLQMDADDEDDDEED